MAEARAVKFCTQVSYIKSARWRLVIGITNCPLNGHGHGHVTSLNFRK